MRKTLLCIGILLSLFVSGCGIKNDSSDITSKVDSYDVVRTKAEVQEGDFIYRLISQREEYSDNKSVEVYGELEYVGTKEEITIYHAASPFYFPMEEKVRGIKIPYPMPEPLGSTTLIKGKPFQVEYTGSGAYSEEDEKEYVKFMKDFIENGFPTGYYLVDGYADFFVQRKANEEPDKYHLEAQIDFKIKRK